jgi:hydrogenase large subunit
MATITAPEATASTQAAPGKLVEMNWDPITRIVGSLGIYTKIDFANRRVAECYSTSSIFRGYSIFMKGKDPRDAHFITSRICGICGDNHATCSVYAQNMAYGVKPPPIAEWIVNLGEAAEYMFDHNIFQDNLVSRRPTPAYGIKRRNPRLPTRLNMAIKRLPTSCGRLTRSPASSTAKR